MLKIGDPAPPIRVAEWVKGKPFRGFEPGKIYIVDFFATWCAPCTQTIPVLSEMANTKEFKSRIEVIGISIMERGGDIPKQVRGFVRQMGGKMNYAVGRDDTESTMEKIWMGKSGQGILPTTFIVDGQGKIAYIGHPLFRAFETALAGLLTGSTTAGSPQAESLKNLSDQGREIAVQARIKQATDLLRQDKKTEGFAALDKAAAEFPDYGGNVARTRFLWLAIDNTASAKEFAQKFAGEAKTPNDVNALGQMAVMLTSHSAFEGAFDLPGALNLAKKAVALRPEDPYLLDLAAGLYFQSGDIVLAVSTQEKALAVLDKSEMRGNREFKSLLEQNLAQYKKAAKP